jgi:prepilin-type N-terminal cleavage/methylation domain-containing protein
MSVSNRNGFTLLEAVVALAILVVTGVAALSALGAELRAAGRSNHALEATALAQDRLARIRLLSSEEMELLPDSLRRGDFAAPFEGYAWRASARGVSDEPDLFDVAVVVSWADGLYELKTRAYRPARRELSP